MAEGFLKKYLTPEDGFEIISAGISAAGGFKPAPETIEVMKEDDIDISSYASKPFLKNFAKAADVILVMADIHKEFILRESPEFKDKICLFKEFADSPDIDKDMADPIGQPISVYRRVKEEIKRASIKIAERIKELK